MRDPQAVAGTIAQVIESHIRQVPRDDKHVANAVTFGQGQLVLQHCAVADFDHWLGDGRGPEPGPFAAGDNDEFHV